MKTAITIGITLLFTPLLLVQAQVPNLELTHRKDLLEKRVLPYPYLNERDILWEKKVWQEIDTRQLKNLSFRYPPMPLFQILINEIRKGDLTAYSNEDDQFSRALCWSDLKEILWHKDTIRTFDPETYKEILKVVDNDPDMDRIWKYRIKEVWFVDSKYSKLNVRILGIAPIQELFDKNGNSLGETPLFWIYYPDARYALSKHKVYSPFAEASPMSWEDWLEMRFFESYIIKESNLHDRQLSAYLSPLEALQKGAKIKEEILNYELDLWSN